jgi:hypothetical protein
MRSSGIKGMRLATAKKMVEKAGPDPNGNRQQRRAAKKIVRKATK